MQHRESMKVVFMTMTRATGLAVWCGLFLSLCPAETVAPTQTAVINVAELSAQESHPAAQPVQSLPAPRRRPIDDPRAVPESRTPDRAPVWTLPEATTT